MIDPTPRRPHPGRTAFTLVELLVAMGVLVLLSTGLFGLLNSVNGVWADARARIVPNRNGRVVLDLIARDLRPAALPADRTNVRNNLQFVIDPTQIDAKYCNPQALFWQAPVATDTTYGNLAEVGYFVRWDTTTQPGHATAQLCRFLVNPETPANPTNYLIYSPTQPTAWLSNNLLDTLAPATAASGYKGWVADNVLAFWARALDASGQPITSTAMSAPANSGRSSDRYAFDSRQGYLDANGVVREGIKINGTVQPLATLPAYIELALFTIDSQTAGRVTTNLSPAAVNSGLAADPAKFWSDINLYRQSLPAYVQKTLMVHTTRVTLTNAR